LITFLHPAAPANHDMVRTLRDRNITSFTMDGIPRVSRAQAMDALTFDEHHHGLQGGPRGSVPFPPIRAPHGDGHGDDPGREGPGGRAGWSAFKPSPRRGAWEPWSPRSTSAPRRGRKPEVSRGRRSPASMSRKRWPSVKAATPGRSPPSGSPGAGSPAGGHEGCGHRHLERARPGEVAPVLITREMVRSMRPGSVVVDVSVDQGGNCEATQAATRSW